MAINGDVRPDYFEEALVKQLTSDIESYLRKKVQPKLDKMIKEIAVDAVGKWSTKINSIEKHTGFERVTEVQVNFVEEVMNQVVQEQVVNVKVNK